MTDQTKWGETKLNWVGWLGGVCFYNIFGGRFLHKKYVKSKFSQLPAIFSVTGRQTKNWSRIFSEDNFTANKLYPTIFFSKLMLFIHNSENVTKNMIGQNFWSAIGQWAEMKTKFLWKISRYIVENFDQLKTDLWKVDWYTSYMSASNSSIFTVFFFAGLLQSGNTGITMQFM